MTGDFWLRLCEWPVLPADAPQALPPLGPWLAGQPAAQLVVEVVRFRDDGRSVGYAVLLSRVDGPDRFRCELGFINRIKRADQLREVGLRMVEAPITTTEQHGAWCIEVLQPLASGAPGDPTGDWMIRIEGVRFELDTDQPDNPQGLRVDTRFEQTVASPALVGTDQNLSEKELQLPVRRTRITSPAIAAEAQVSFRLRAATTSHDAAPPQPIPVQPVDAPVSGRFELAEAAGAVATTGLRPLLAPNPVRRVARPAAFTPTGFRFDDVELFGFRIDLPQNEQSQQVLDTMVNRLNFHRQPHEWQPSRGAQAFRFRPASLSVAIELLRYGRMYWGEDERPRRLWPANEAYTSQHELLLRLLVGRVDDASTQARDPALYVPAIFVDNPWSKVVGRELQGFKKRLVRFCVDDQPLTLDGYRLSGGERVRLSQVNRVCAIDAIDDKPGAPLLELTLPPGADDGRAWADLGGPADHGAPDPWRGARWRQRHFVDEEFRRGFAREVLTQGVDRLQSIQVTPVDHRGLPRAWITGTFGFDSLQAVQPDGVATLTLGDLGGSCPRAWGLLKGLLPGGRVSLPTGDWYHARGSLRMKIGRGFV